MRLLPQKTLFYDLFDKHAATLVQMCRELRDLLQTYDRVEERQQHIKALERECDQITHDLATAYYISDYIAVMHRGSIVEFGPGKQVLSDPQHSYTKLLLDSIPTIKHKWSRAPRSAAGGGKLSVGEI